MTCRRTIWEFRVAIVLVALAGALVGHILTFSSIHVHADGRGHVHDAVHGYVPLLSWIVVPLALAAVARMVWRGRNGLTNVGYGTLVAMQLVGFGTQELGERLIAGGTLPQLLADPVFWVGLATQVVVAATVPAVLATAKGARVFAWLPRPVVVLARVVAAVAPASVRIVASRPQPILRRGPPGAASVGTM